MWDVLLDAVLDTLKLMPLLLAVHVVIEVFEYTTASKIQVNKILKSRLAPLIGTGLGVIPQCGFSVVATDLYARRAIHLGTLLAVYVATSDEAIPILLSDPKSAVKLLPLIGIKIVLALLLGYTVNFVMGRRKLNDVEVQTSVHGCHGHTLTRPDEHAIEDTKAAEHVHAHTHAEQSHEDEHTHRENRPARKKFDWKAFVLHPVLHTLTVSAYIFIINFLFGTAIYFITEERLIGFMGDIRYLQPLLSALIGLIPNCASSVAITRMYALGGLSLGAAVAGLTVNAGLGFAVLFKENKPLKENLLILVGLYVFAVAAGLIVTAIAAPFGL